MTTATNKPEALITTPAESAECPTCMDTFLYFFNRDGADYTVPAPTCSRFSPTEFAHCDSCGSTDLVDTRSPFEVLAEAVENAQAPIVVEGSFFSEAVREAHEIETRLYRQDVADRVRAIAATADPGHCSDCTTWAVRVAVKGVRF